MAQELTIDNMLDILSELNICDITVPDSMAYIGHSSICEYCLNRSKNWCREHCNVGFEDQLSDKETFKQCWRRYIELRLEEKRQKERGKPE